ncbi:MAG: sugar ABC transporter substrate-binding protein [Chloroflexi bacterium]|nr:sugar ABC transporter substrate-binding protein [Chloroflexota bacterium]
MTRSRSAIGPLILTLALALAACATSQSPGASPSGGSSPGASSPGASSPGGSAPTGSAPAASEPTASEPAATAAYEGTIDWWHLGYAPGGATASAKLVDAAVAAYKAKNPGLDIVVTGIPFDDQGLARLDTAIAAGNGPDLFRIASDRLPGYGAQGVLSPIDEYLTDEDKADILPNLLEGVAYEGQHLAWPQWVPPVGFYLNNSIFEAAGVDIPDADWTVEEFQQLAQDLTGDNVYGFATYMGPASVNELTLLYNQGATVLSEDNSTYTLNSPAGVKGLQVLADLFEAGALPPDSTTIALPDVEQGFIDGRFAMMTGGSGSITNLKANAVEFTVLPPPIGDAGEAVTVGGMGTYAVPQKDDPARMAAAHRLGRYLTSAEVAADVPGWYLAPGTRQSIKVSETTPEMAPFEEMLPNVRFMPLIEDWAKVDSFIHPEIQLAVSGQKSPQEALDAIGEQVTPLLGQ